LLEGKRLYKGPWIFIHPTAPHIGHSQHLCEMVKRGDQTLKQIKLLVREAQFICAKCGRIAAKEENLCKPELL
jgi:hypothetical protein